MGYSDFMTCTGIDALIGKIAFSGFDVEKMDNDIMEKCDFDILEDSSETSQVQLMECLGVIFSKNNPVGDFVRDLYEHTGKWCSCVHEIGEKIPECIMEENGFKVSTSLIKSATCIVGVGCGAYKDFCGQQTVTLEKCLPGVDEEYDCTKVMVDCAKDGAVYTALPHVISHHLPDTCQDVAQESTIAKFESFQKKCAGKKDFLAPALVIFDEAELHDDLFDDLFKIEEVDFFLEKEEEQKEIKYLRSRLEQ